MNGILSILVAYLIGGIPFGFVLVRLRTGKDVRSMGSGNIGATNVFRTTSRAVGLLTLVLDILKGWLAIKVASLLTGGNLTWMVLAALAVMLGHAFPIFLKFQGGKAVACFVGAWLYLQPLPLLAAMIVLVVVVAMTRYISLGSILAAGLFPLAVWLINHPPLMVVAVSAACGGLVVWRHQGNIRRLRAGTENVFSLGGRRP
jgi:acyl phosphate:glycerol-3-phosphate acyltransferase